MKIKISGNLNAKNIDPIIIAIFERISPIYINLFRGFPFLRCCLLYFLLKIVKIIKSGKNISNPTNGQITQIAQYKDAIPNAIDKTESTIECFLFIFSFLYSSLQFFKSSF